MLSTLAFGRKFLGRALVVSTLISSIAGALAAPDELRLGRAKGYPVGNAQNWYTDESVRVGTFSHQGEIPGIGAGGVHTVAAAVRPMPLPRAAAEPDYRWSPEGLPTLTINDYLARQRVTGILIVKDGVVQVERYQYGRTAQHRFWSASINKSIVAFGVGIALAEGKIGSLEDRIEKYEPRLAATGYGKVTVRELLRMSSGLRFVEQYSGVDDLARYNQARTRAGIVGAAAVLKVRDAPPGMKFNYSSADADVLGVVLRGAVGMSLADYLAPRLWQAIGAEQSALWRTDREGIERAAGAFNAPLRDYARLGIVLANDGARPDLAGAPQIIPKEFLLDATSPERVPNLFKPGKATPYFGYGYQTWLFPGVKRRFALVGVFGQSIFVDPELKLVMVHTGVNATAGASGTSLARERDALWRALVVHYGNNW